MRYKGKLFFSIYILGNSPNKKFSMTRIMAVLEELLKGFKQEHEKYFIIDE